MELSRKMVDVMSKERDEFRETELCLGLLWNGGGENESVKGSGKRGFAETVDLKLNIQSEEELAGVDLNEDLKKNGSLSDETLCSKDPLKPPSKAQVVGWPPVRSYRKNMMAQKSNNEGGNEEMGSHGRSAAFVKVCMDGAPYLRKVDLKIYTSYQELSDSLAKMFSSFTMGNYGQQGMIDFMNERKLMDLLNSSEYVPTYEDKDGDWMLVGDVPWEMFVDSCKRLRIMKGSEAWTCSESDGEMQEQKLKMKRTMGHFSSDKKRQARICNLHLMFLYIFIYSYIHIFNCLLICSCNIVCPPFVYCKLV